MVSDLFGQDDLKEMSDKEGGEVAYFSPPKEICLVVLFSFFFSGGGGFFFRYKLGCRRCILIHD